MRNPGDKTLRELERRAMHDVQAAHAYAVELDRRGMRRIDVPGGYSPGMPRLVVFHPGTPENPTGWYVVAAGSGTWTRDRWSSAELALQAAVMIERINSDGSVYLRTSVNQPYGYLATIDDPRAWRERSNPDERMRDLERRACDGDVQARAALERARQRVTPPCGLHAMHAPCAACRIVEAFRGGSFAWEDTDRDRASAVMQDMPTRQLMDAALVLGADQFVSAWGSATWEEIVDAFRAAYNTAASDGPAPLRQAWRALLGRPIRQYLPWVVETHDRRYDVVHAVTGATRPMRGLGTANLTRARDLAHRLNHQLTDDEVLRAFLRGDSAVGRNITSHGTSIDYNGMGGTAWAHVDVYGVIRERDTGSRTAQRWQQRLRRLYRAHGAQGHVMGYPEAGGQQNPAPLAVMGLGPLPLGLLNPDGPGEVGHGPRHKELQPKYEKQKLSLEQAKRLVLEANGADGERFWKNAIERSKMFNEAEPKYAEALTYDDGKDEHTVKVVVGLGLVPEKHYLGLEGGNKADTHWVHKHAKKNMPLDVLDPETGITFQIGGEFRVTDWYREKKKNT